jgi:hypothetical protein
MTPEHARANEQGRWRTVINSAEYKGREKLADKLLANTPLGAEDIIKALKAAPSASAGSPAPAAYDDPNLASFQAPNVATGWWNPQLYEAGRASPMEILGRKE